MPHLFPWKLQDKNSTITQFLSYKTLLFQHSHHHWLCIFIRMNRKEPACCACNSLHQQKWPTVSVATAGMQRPLPQCAHIHCLVSINEQQISANVSKCHFFHMEEFSDATLLHLHFHARHHSFRLPFCCHLSHGNNMSQVQTSAATPPISASGTVGQRDKVGGITFGATLTYAFLFFLQVLGCVCLLLPFWADFIARKN